MIALDAMGGDNAPLVTVQGALAAARKGVQVGLFGDEKILIPLLTSFQTSWHQLPISLVHCSQRISMADEPSRAIIKQKDSSLVKALQAVVEGTASGLVTAGNSGAALVGGTLILGRVPGILRPALGNFLPTQQGTIFCLDLGANTECKPEFLYQFACMGHQYVKQVKNIPEPRIALLSNGHEPYKGSQLVKQAFKLLERGSLNFIGNLEARDIFDDKADVLVCDGFTGNIMLKSVQGAAKTMSSWIKLEAARLAWYRKLGFALGRPIFTKIKSTMSYADKGGALLLGLKHPLIVAHGCASAVGIEQGLLMAHEYGRSGFLPKFNQDVVRMVERSVAHITDIKIQPEYNNEKTL